MLKELRTIEDHLKKNLTRPAESIIIIGLIEKMLKDNVKTKVVTLLPEVSFCPSCKEWITEEEINTVETFKQTLEEPSEHESFCKCGAPAEDLEEMNLGADDLCEVLNKLKYRM